MNYSLWLCVAATTLAGGGFLYIALAWRRAPRVFRAMNWVAAVSVTAGFLLALPLVHWLTPLFSPSSDEGAATSWNRVKAAMKGACPPAGVPVGEVGKALIMADEHHAGDSNWLSNAEQAELCKEGVPPMESHICVETFIARHALGLDMKYGDHRGAIPCEEVAESCDGGALDKDSALCKEAYRTRNARLDKSP